MSVMPLSWHAGIKVSMGKNKRKTAVFVGIILIVCVAAGTVVYLRSDMHHYRKTMKTADSLYAEGKYEEALGAYNAALKIDEESEEAQEGIRASYIGISNDYVREGEYEQAITVLQQGYRETDDMRLESQRKYLLNHIVVTQCERYVVNTGELRGITGYDYDTSGKLTSETEQIPDERGVPYRTVQISYSYDHFGNLADVVRQSYQSDGSEGGRTEGYYRYSSSGEVVGYEDQYYDSAGEAGTTRSILYSYDDAGNLTSERQQSVNRNGVETNKTETVYEYDQSGKLIKKVLTRYYDDWSYPAGKEETVYTYDRFGNLLGDTFQAFYDDGSWEEISTYNVLGYKTLTTYYDGDIEYIYTYDFIGNLWED